MNSRTKPTLALIAFILFIAFFVWGTHIFKRYPQMAIVDHGTRVQVTKDTKNKTITIINGAPTVVSTTFKLEGQKYIATPKVCVNQTDEKGNGNILKCWNTRSHEATSEEIKLLEQISK